MIILLLTLLVSLFAGSIYAQSDPRVNLTYGVFQGKYDSNYNISYFRKIPFAAPPTGVNRFRGPQPVLPVNGVYDSSQTFDMCPQRTVNGSEDCLYLGLYSRPWSAGKPLRPVVVVFYGGAFIQGGGSFSIPPSGYPILNESRSNDFIFVYPNYRVNAFGFLPGKALMEDPQSDLNVGLLDQHAVLKWVHQNIRAFRGDPTEVTIWGQSAGGGSVVGQAIANTTLQAGLFKRALASSPFWPKAYRYDSPESEAVYRNFANLAGCGSTNNSLTCLKNADLQKLRDASLVIAGSHTYNTSSYTWAPVIGDSFLPLSLTDATVSGHVNMESAWGMYNTHEGENFIPSVTSTFDTWVRGFLPTLSSANISTLLSLYPASGSTETESYNDTTTRAGLIYRDIILACPTYWLAASSPQKAYVGEYNIAPAKHASDTIYWNQVNAAQTQYPERYRGFAGSFAGFFQKGDPNAVTDGIVPELKTTDSEWTIKESGFGTVKLKQLKDRCGFWRSVAASVPV